MLEIRWSSGDYDRNLHQPGTNGWNGVCSWIEACPDELTHTTLVHYPSGEHRTFALCDRHEERLESLYI